MKKVLPNLLTTFNLLAGTLGLYYILGQKDLFTAGILILIGSIFDFLDGLVARLLKTASDFGKELDSLSDLVTFGLLPAFIMHHFIYNITENVLLSKLAILIAIFSALRLAYFNISEQKNHFIGLPTPMNAIFIATLALWTKFNYAFIHISIYNIILANSIILTTLVILLSLLLVTPIKLIALKSSKIGQKSKIIFLIASFISIVLFGAQGGIFCLIFYFLVSFIENFVRNLEKK